MYTRKGSLKIFFSGSKGSGKTLSMIKAAQLEKSRGTDVLVGCIASHTPDAVLSYLKDMEQMPFACRNLENTFDLDQVLLRRPQLVLVDELAHANEKECRHRKRYQDIEELLEAGINVYTTVNVGNIESLYDTVASITGISDWERIPDAVFDNADQVELIDAEPEELLRRLLDAYPADSQTTPKQLAFLREIALRRCADRVKHLSGRMQYKNTVHTENHILACLSASPSNARIIRTAARMAEAFNSQFTALFVETPDFSSASPEDKQRLHENRRLAQQLGANVETVYGEGVAYQIAEFSRLSGVTKIVLGRSVVTHRHFPGKAPLTELLLSYVPEIDIHIIPDGDLSKAYRPKKIRSVQRSSIAANTAKSVGILVGATLLGILFFHLGFTEANIIMVYILGVLLTSIATSHQIYSLVSSIASVFIFNFMFTTPRFSLMAYETGYPVTFVVMFLTAYITGTFALRYKKQAGQSAKIARRTKILFDTDQLLSRADGKDEILHAAAKQIQKLLNRNIVIFENQNGCLSKPCLFYTNASGSYDLERERSAAEWTLKNNHAAGATTDTLSDAHYLYLALRINERVYGVMGIEAESTPLEASEHSILLSILSETALALENEKNAREKEAAAVLAESEQLRANLLRTISHDLRTPLTTISGNASNLISNGDSFDEATKHQIYSDIYNDSIWLIDLVENLLYATRIEDGRMTLRTSTELLSEIIEEAIRRFSRKAQSHRLNFTCCDDLLLVNADAKLVVQVICNILDNAVKYTPPGTQITIMSKQKGNMAEVQIADTGNGIPDEDKQKIFDKFYSGSNKIADNRRSLGLGLYLCKAIVEAHGGTISAKDNLPHGAEFAFTLPLKEVSS
ncbi:MAG: sensor histidine kinase KdpD [Eubacteriales bacterium]|nr:sensor histidine kinase KdpD [Eubacteriales bacterium]